MNLLACFLFFLYRAEPSIAISQSNSMISLWQLSPSGPQLSQRWVAHEYELWIVHFDTHTPDLLYSGADDCKFKCWDVRAGGSSNNIRSSVFVDETHSMGVCSIASHPTRSHVLATGSYDESLRIWDTRSLRKPLLMQEHALGGGVWRVRWNPATGEDDGSTRADSILCAAMHNGFAVVDLNFEAAAAVAAVEEGKDSAAAGDAGIDSAGCHLAAASLDGASSSSSAVAAAHFPSSVTATTAVTYKAHSSLAYGADWIAQPARWLPSTAAAAGSKESAPNDLSWLERDVIATCSFYDKQLDIWTVDAHASADEAAQADAAPDAATAAAVSTPDVVAATTS